MKKVTAQEAARVLSNGGPRLVWDYTEGAHRYLTKGEIRDGKRWLAREDKRLAWAIAQDEKRRREDEKAAREQRVVDDAESLDRFRAIVSNMPAPFEWRP